MTDPPDIDSSSGPPEIHRALGSSSVDLEAVWTILESHRPHGRDIETSGTGVTLVAGEVLAGIDELGQRHLLIPLRGGEAARTDTRGSGAQLVRVPTAEGQYLSMVCLSHELRGVFGQFAAELLSSVLTADSPARAASDGFQRWRSLFVDPSSVPLLGEERLVGVLGELATITALLEQGATGDLAWWTGPGGHQHDIRTHGRALEVKSTLVREGRIVEIHGIDQLDAPSDVSLHLVHHQFERNPDGQNLASAILLARQAGARSDKLAEGVRRVGAGLLDTSETDLRRYRHTGESVYDVRGAHFPRLTRSSFAGGALPPGILRLAYSIDLTNQPPVPLDEPATRHLLSKFAKATAEGNA